MVHSARSRGSDRAIMRTKWQTLTQEADELLELSSAADHFSRPVFMDALALIDRAAQLPIPEQSPGGATLLCLHLCTLAFARWLPR